jgi:hypothetical protein
MGGMAEIKIYKKCRSKNKIKEDYKFKGKGSSCILYYSFDKKLKTGEKIKDLSGNKNHGKLTGKTEKIKIKKKK